MDKAPDSDAYGEVRTIVHDPKSRSLINVPTAEWEEHRKRVETLALVLRDVLLAMADVPPFSMMVSAEQKAMLKAL